MIANAHGRLLYYLGCGGGTSSSRTMTTIDKASSKQAPGVAFAASDVAPD